jgi:hypothetical protein
MTTQLKIGVINNAYDITPFVGFQKYEFGMRMLHIVEFY